LTIVGTGSLADKSGGVRTGSATVHGIPCGLIMDQAGRVKNLVTARLSIAGATFPLMLGWVREISDLFALPDDPDEPEVWHGFVTVAGKDAGVSIDPVTWEVTFWDCVQRKPYAPEPQATEHQHATV